MPGLSDQRGVSLQKCQKPNYSRKLQRCQKRGKSRKIGLTRTVLCIEYIMDDLGLGSRFSCICYIFSDTSTDTDVDTVGDTNILEK